jgi:2-keto-4-pentenoate hydratase
MWARPSSVSSTPSDRENETVNQADTPLAVGMSDQLGRRGAELVAGARAVGWKLGLTSPAVQRHLGLEGPVVGYLNSVTEQQPGGTCALGGMEHPAVEAEVAIHLGQPVAPGAGADQARAAIAGLGPAIELVDAAPPFEDLYTILAEDIFHRGFVLGPADPSRTDVEGIAATVTRGEAEEASGDAAEAMDDPADVVRYVADFLAQHGGELEAGQVIIAGALTDPLPVSPGDRVTVSLGPLGELALSFG